MDLTISDRADLDRLETTINRGLRTFVEVGQALAEIRDRRLYRDTHDTFEDYCRGRWEMSRRRAYQLIDASSTIENVNHGSQPTPTSERQVRPLTTIRDEDGNPDPEKQREVWGRAVESAEDEGVPVAARHVEAAKAPPGEPPTNKSDLFVWRLQNLYRQAPRRAQNRFRKWVVEAENTA